MLLRRRPPTRKSQSALFSELEGQGRQEGKEPWHSHILAQQRAVKTTLDLSLALLSLPFSLSLFAFVFFFFFFLVFSVSFSQQYFHALSHTVNTPSPSPGTHAQAQQHSHSQHNNNTLSFGRQHWMRARARAKANEVLFPSRPSEPNTALQLPAWILSYLLFFHSEMGRGVGWSNWAQWLFFCQGRSKRQVGHNKCVFFFFGIIQRHGPLV